MNLDADQADININVTMPSAEISLSSIEVGGIKGDQGEPGQGVPAGGSPGQVLAKLDDQDYNTVWVEQTGGSGGGDVSSVNGQTGAVVLGKSDVGLGSVDNTSDLNKPLSTSTTTALSNKVDKVAGKELSSNDYTSSEKTKLSGIAANATQNSSDASLRDRSTHTGSQAVSTITGLQTALNSKADSSSVPAQFNPIAGTNVSLSGTYPNITFNSTGGGGGTGVTDHGALTGLTDDDHTQYHNDARGDARYNLKSEVTVFLAEKANVSNPTFSGTVTTGTQIGGGFGTAISVLRDGVQVGRIDNNGGGLRLQAAAGNLQLRGSGNSGIEIDGGGNATIAGTANGRNLAADGTKLDGIAAGATANSSDATLLNRANHTGSQAQSTVTNLTTDLAAKAPLNSPAFTGTPTGITKAHVGLANVDNTSDLNKPVSTATQTALDGKANIDTSQPSPIQFYGASRVYIDYPNTGNGVNGDPAIADDRNGPTGKLWLFYFSDSNGALKRVEIPYVGAKPSELGVAVDSGITGRVNHFVNIDGEWYCGNVNKIYKFTRLDQAPTLLSTVSVVGSNGDQSYVANASVNRHSNGTWYAWYATYNGTTAGIRRATASSPSGPWTIAPGFWLTPAEVGLYLTWLRIFHVIEDTWGRFWAVAGAGYLWGGTAQPDMDDAASVWMAPVSDITQKPTLSEWQCVIDPPYFAEAPVGTPLFNNAYAPTFIQDGKDWYAYVNTGKYAKERIVELRPNLPASWTHDLAATAATDRALTTTYFRLPNMKAFMRDGKFKVTITGTAFNFSATAQYHTVHIRLLDIVTQEVLTDYQMQVGDRAYESRPLPNTVVVVTADGARRVQLEARYEVGSGQTAPATGTSVLRSMTMVVERLSD